MIKVSVMYSSGNSVKFNTDYYKNTHLPMVAKAIGDSLKGMDLDLGLAGIDPGARAPYVAIAHLKFDDVASFQASFAPHAATFADDLKNYSNVKGELQISELITF